ncbi:hypothetical protein ACFLVY_00410, partial [Chloroflexota bacterium]
EYLKLDISPVASGVVNLNGTVLDSYPAIGRFYGKVVVTLEAIPITGYEFTHWSGDLVGVENPVSLTVSNDSLISANFSPIMRTMTVEVDGGGTTNPGVGLHEYSDGTLVKITAMPSEGWQFDSWAGDVSDLYSISTIVSLNSDKTVSANFSRITRTMTVEVDGGGTTNPGVGLHEYSDGTLVKITAMPSEGWQFDSWAGDVSDPNSISTIVCLKSDRVVTAKFSRTKLNLPFIGYLTFIGVPALIVRLVLNGNLRND